MKDAQYNGENNIHSKSNATYKRLLSLLSKKGRTREGAFLVESSKLIRDLLQSSYEVEALLFDGEKYESDASYRDKIDALLSIRQAVPVPVICLTQSLIKGLSTLETPEGILAVAKKPTGHAGNPADTVGIAKNDRMAEHEAKRHAVNPANHILLLDHIQDPGNLGTMLRSAEAFGFFSVYTLESVDFYNPKVLRAAMGSSFRLDLREVHFEALHKFTEMGYRIYGTAMHGTDYRKMKKADKVILVIGNEGQGMRDEVFALCKEKLSIPMQGEVESLNAAISAAVLMSAFADEASESARP